MDPDLLENAYEACLCYELQQCGLFVEKQKALPLIYNEVNLEIGYRIDLLVERKVIVEIKAVGLAGDSVYLVDSGIRWIWKNASEKRNSNCISMELPNYQIRRIT